ncbi:hypothetical protein L596_030868 [Steinernema carpocapsae]|uniref:Uncharacterized protein n=1 Tax=Steinernema carpocapsae TaxID=34508 RepID=A0A4U5LND9_STECR|nr:hypothetical protein L596_030868 [Steinernema carpocapsae]
MDGEPAHASRTAERRAGRRSPIREPGYVTYVKRERKRLLISDVQSGRLDGRSTILVKGAMGARWVLNNFRTANDWQC